VPAPKSLLRSPAKLRVDAALNSHDCQHSSAHRIKAGDRRLKLFTDPRSPDHFCVECALKMIQSDMARLDRMAKQLRGELALDPPPKTKKRPARSA